MGKILVTGGGAPGGPGIINCLLKDSINELVVCDANPHASGGKLSLPFEVIPRHDHPEFLETILAICSKYEIEKIIPLVTKELEVFAKNIDVFVNRKIKVAVSSLEGFEIAVNKSRLLKHLKENDIKVPDFEVLSDVSQLKSVFTKLGYPEAPVCIKPALSSGSRGFRIVDSTYDKFQAFFHEKPNSVYTTPEDLMEIFSGHVLPEMIVMEYLPGMEYTVDCLIQNGVTKLILPRSRRTMVNGISTSGEFVNDPEIIKYCQNILNVIKLDGPIGIQVKRNCNGDIRILEINPRLQGTSVAALGVGINLPQGTVDILDGKEVSYDIDKIAWGTKFIRYFQELYY